MIVALMSLVIAGCATTEYVEVKPECTVPAKPSLPMIKKADTECLNKDTYWALMDRERRLVDWALSMESQLTVLCGE